MRRVARTALAALTVAVVGCGPAVAPSQPAPSDPSDVHSERVDLAGAIQAGAVDVAAAEQARRLERAPSDEGRLELAELLVDAWAFERAEALLASLDNDGARALRKRIPAHAPQSPDPVRVDAALSA